jgi:S2P endopeptidase
MASLSLYFFNLLPLPVLDGSQLLGALLDMTALSGGSRIELVDLEEGAGRRRTALREGRNRWKNRIRMTTEGVASVMCLTCIVLQMIDLIQ